AVTGGGAAPVVVHLDRVSDDRRFTVRADEPPQGLVEMAVPVGRYRLCVGDPDSRFVAEGRFVEVTGEAEAPVAVPAREQPRLVIELNGIPLKGAVVCLRDRCWRVDLEDPGRGWYLPAHGRAVVRATTDVGVRLLPVSDERDGLRRAVLRRAEPNVIHLPTLKGKYHVRLFWGDFALEEGEEGLRILTHESGRLTVLIEEEGSARLTVEVPDGPGAVVVIDEVRFQDHAEERIRVLAPDGSEVAANLDVRDPAVLPPGSGDEAPDGDDPGGAVLVRVEDQEAGAEFVPSYRRLEGPGPYEVRLGSAGVTLRVRGEDGPVEDAKLYVDGSLFDPGDDEGATFRLRGFQPGPHLLIVGAAGCVGRVMRLVLAENETRRLEVTLPRRR
ncbi:MAG: hypothetical protein ACE5JG_05360, partial [Planctomycetota bacterium]